MAAAPNGAHGATIATLETKVAALELGQADLKRTLLDLDSKVDQSIAGLATRVESSLSSLANKLEAKNTTNWPVLISGLGAVITIVTLLGTMAFLPIQRDTSRLDTAVAAILDRGVFQREYAADELRTKEDLRTLRADLSTRITLPRYNADQERTTHALDESRVRTYDHFGRIAKTEQAVTDLERRFDAISRRLAEYIRDNGRRPVPN